MYDLIKKSVYLGSFISFKMMIFQIIFVIVE